MLLTTVTFMSRLELQFRSDVTNPDAAYFSASATAAEKQAASAVQLG